MDISVEAKANLIMRAIEQDRVEIQAIRKRIYDAVSQITISSFAITAFLIGREGPGALTSALSGNRWLPLIDVSFLIVLWALFLRSKRDLDVGHTIVEAREQMLREAGPSSPLDIYRAVDCATKPKIRENELYWIAGAATFALALKLAVVCTLIAG